MRIALDASEDGGVYIIYTSKHIRKDLIENIEHLDNVHPIHTWCLTRERPLITMHATIGEGACSDTLFTAINLRLVGEFGVNHTTVQIVREVCTH